MHFVYSYSYRPCLTLTELKLPHDDLADITNFLHQTEQIETIFIKGILSDHSSDSALNFHKIQDVCIFVMVLDV